MAGGFPNPTVLRFAPDGRLFIAGKQGELWIVRRGDRRPPRPALTLDVDFEGERGLVGIAFDPDYVRNGFVYLQYTARTPTIHNRVSRFTVDQRQIDPATELVLIELEPQDAVFHVAGALAFGPDGKLYVGTGDNVRGSEAQSFASLLGKVLRINPDGSIPEDNPYYEDVEGPHRAIWAYGLRNAFTIASDPATGLMMVNDTGEETAEEINVLERGANYGWPAAEGYSDDPRYVSPLHAYLHEAGDDITCAIDGGAFYRSANPTFPPRLIGAYLFIDYCASWLRALDPGTGAVETLGRGLGPIDAPISQIVGLDVGPDGAVYLIDRSSGSIYQIQYTGSLLPHIGEQPRTQIVQAGSVATFSLRANGGAALSYQWRRDGEDIPGATDPVLQVRGARADHGAEFSCLVRNELGVAVSRTARLLVELPSARYLVSPPVTWRTNEPLTYVVSLMNTGRDVWNSTGELQVHLAVYFGQEGGVPPEAYQSTDQRLALPEDVPPGASTSVSVTVTPPSDAGAYLLRHELVKEGVAWFGDGVQTPVRVLPVISIPVLAGLATVMVTVAGLIVVWLRRAWSATASSREEHR